MRTDLFKMNYFVSRKSKVEKINDMIIKDIYNNRSNADGHLTKSVVKIFETNMLQNKRLN